MIEDLVTSSCEACRVDAPVLKNNEIQELLSQIPSWRVFEEENTKKIICSFVFLNYEEDHHPEIMLEWGKVTVTWWSHKIKGLHRNDFICASKTDALFEKIK